MKPVFIAQTPETRKIVRLPDGTLQAMFLVAPDGNWQHAHAAMTVSRDHGHTWTEPQILFPLQAGIGLWGGWDALIAHDGEVHLWFLNDRGTGVFGMAMGEGDKSHAKLFGTCLDIWHCKTTHGRSRWTTPKCIWKGYTGSLNSVIQLKSGRIVLPFSYMTGRHWFNRGDGLDAFNYTGTFACTVIYSDDAGETWNEGTKDLKVWVPEPTETYGACEPVALELKDGRVWMLIRAQTGRQYESFSNDGANWSIPRPTRLISSDSPVGLTRLLDGRIVMIWNVCLRYPYAFGGRQVIHAAISEDEGKTWVGFREVARDPHRHEPPPTTPTGDFGTAYPYPSVTADNKVIYVTGQGKGRILAMLLDPAWLYETRQTSDFSDAEEWATFGTRGVSIQPHPERAGAKALRITKELPGATAAAVWNFPSAALGAVKIRLRAERGAKNFRISLSDHFSTPFDIEDGFHALFNFAINDSTTADSMAISPEVWHTIELRWDCTGRRNCALKLNGKPVQFAPLQHETLGACYLRLVSTAEPNDPAGYWVNSVDVVLATED